MRFLLPLAAILCLVATCAGTGALAGAGYYEIACRVGACKILKGPFVEQLDCAQAAARDRNDPYKMPGTTFSCRHFDGTPDDDN